MKFIDRLNAKFGRYAVPNLTVFFIVGQVIAYLVNSAPHEGGQPLVDNILFIPDKVMAGEWWRLVTFLFTPPSMNMLFAFFFWYLFYLMGTTLEAQWGAFRFNLFLLLGYVASVAMAFVAFFTVGTGGEAATNAFLYGTVFLAFARLYPDFELMLFFVLPVKVRWLAMFQWIIYGVTLVFADSWLERAMVIGAVFNYLVFFGPDIARDMKHGHRRMQSQSRAIKGGKGGAIRMEHRCHVCGLTNIESPHTQFRYCSECGGEYCYCPDHLPSHEHVKSAPQTEKEKAP